MDLGKLKLPIGRVYNGDASTSLADVYTAFNLLRNEVDILPGYWSFTASVAIAKGSAVNLSSGQLRLADASLSRPAIGVAAATVLAGEKLRIMAGIGHLAGLTGLTADATVYLGNAGALLFTRPASGNIQSLGYTLSTTDLFVLIESDLAADGSGGGGSGLTHPQVLARGLGC